MNYLEVYDSSFSDNNYSVHNNQEFRYQFCIKYLQNHTINSLIDVGSGRGVFLKMIYDIVPDIVSVDLNNYHNINGIKFIQANLANQNDRDHLMNMCRDNKYDLLTCLDVLEHLDKTFIENVLEMFAKLSKVCILTIANHSDIFNGVELHTIQEDFEFWGPLIKKYFKIIDCNEHYIHNNKPRLFIVTVESL